MKGLGAKHAAMNLEQAHYDLVGQALLDTLAKATGDSFTTEVKEAWAGVYKVIVANMMEGAKAKKQKDENTATKPEERMEDAIVELRRITAEKVNQALLNYEKMAMADQARIQAEVAEEMKRVEEFKAKQAAEESAKETEMQQAPTATESDSDDTPVEDVEMDGSTMTKGMDESDILYNQRSCAQYVFDKLFARA